jgi:PilZ domain-containing protein
MKSSKMPENRLKPRFPLQLPVAVTGDSVSDRTKTDNISAGGVLFHVDVDVAVGSTIAFTIQMPAAALGTPKDVQVNCTGRVVRCSREDRRHAVAVVIDDYEFQK